MIGKLLSILRDFFLFCTLIALVQIALEQNVSFLLEHKKSLTHELDRDFIDQIYTAQRHIHSLEQHAEYGTIFADVISDIKSKLSAIEEQYKKNSPSLALLGPIGTASIVLKEEKLHNKLLSAVNETSTLLHTINNNLHAFELSTSIDNGLNANKKSLKTLV